MPVPIDWPSPVFVPGVTGSAGRARKGDGGSFGQDESKVSALWRSGFRIEETFTFTWEPSQYHHIINIDGRRPMIGIAAEHEKGGKLRLLLIAPDFAFLLRGVPKRRRIGQVFKWPGMRGGYVTQKTVEKRLAKIGVLAGVIVGTNTDGSSRYATAHDFRRSFGARWATKVIPQFFKP